ncbi:uncharacterized protein LOC132639454 [Lycium barbarum]|uniref:uncharacterized protein LOC132639454 n=1 Tax=Lycium barbarum TaxID=112863 RepID=UPI00293E1400|nr:uncharacterized protein LOC132639454 [Lycium barbarum]
MPPGMYQVQKGPYQEGPAPPVENVHYADYIAKGDIPGPIQRYCRPQQGQGAYHKNQGNYTNNYGGSNQGRYNNNNGNFGNKSSNPYIPPKGQSNDQGSSRLESMLEKVLASQMNTEKTLSGLSKTVAIQNLEQQMHGLSREQLRAKKRGLPSDTIPNPKNRGGGLENSFAISTRSGKILQSADKKVIDLDPVNEEELVQSNVPNVDDAVRVEERVADIPNVAADTNAVKEMPGFDKFLKYLLTKKRSVQYETVNLTHQLSSIIASTTVKKKKDPGAFTIPCNIRHHSFTRAFCDNGVNINLMPLATYKKSEFGMPRPNSIRLQMADRSIKRPVGVVDDVLVSVGKFMLPTDLVILDFAVDKDIPIILRKPFLATARALIGCEKN